MIELDVYVLTLCLISALKMWLNDKQKIKIAKLNEMKIKTKIGENGELVLNGQF